MKCILLRRYIAFFLSGKVRGEFKEIVHTIATVQTIDVSTWICISIKGSVQIDALLEFP